MNKYKKEVLSNKIPLFTVPIKNAKTATVLIMIKTGSRYENRRNNGISHFLEHLFFKGTKKRSTTLALSSELDSLGGEYNAFTAKEYTGYWVKVTEEKLGQALDILNDMLLNSQFDPVEIEREKGVIIEELNMYQDNPLMHIEDVFEGVLYGDTPAGWETIGTKHNIQNFKRTDFIKYLKTQYGSRSIYAVLAGGLKEKDKKMAAKMLLNFQTNKWQNRKKITIRQSHPQLKVVHKKIDQVNLSLGVRTFPVGHPDEFIVKLFAIVLGGAMSSRLFIRLRERNGLAYYVRTNAEFYPDTGYLTSQAGVPINGTKEAIKIILEEYQKLTEELVSQDELKRAKDLLRGRLLLQMEATDNLANWYGRQAILRQKILTPADFLNKIKKINPNDLRRVAKKIFINQGLNLAIIGNVQAKDCQQILHF